jgi:hypothetical protein
VGEIFDKPINGTTTIWEDNQSAIAYSQTTVANEKTTHIGMKWRSLKAHVGHGTIMRIIAIVSNSRYA